MYKTEYIADRIKSEVKKSNRRMKDMLAECNLSINTVSELSKGKQISSLSLAKIADYLGCSVDYLLGRTDEPNLHSSGEIEKAFYSAPASIQDAIKKLLDIDHMKG